MKIKAAASLIMVVALISALLPCGLALPSTTAPAFLWSPYLHRDSYALALLFFFYTRIFILFRIVTGIVEMVWPLF